jgi:plasmid maintenance system antidote protein VapI
VEAALAKQVYELGSTYLDQLARQLGIPRKRALRLIEQMCMLYANTVGTPKDRNVWRELAKSYRRAQKIGLKQWTKRMSDEEGRLFLEHIEKARTNLNAELIRLQKGLSFRGGNPRKLSLANEAVARAEVLRLSMSGKPKEVAYEEVAKSLGVSPHTIRRACDKKEAERSGYKSLNNSIGFLSGQK